MTAGLGVFEYRHDREPAGGGRLDAAPGAADRPAGRRRPGVPARHRPVPREVAGSSSRSCCRSSRRRRSSSSTARCEAPPEYIGFVVLGGAMTAFWLNVIWMMASQLCWEKSQGNLELYFAAPMYIMSVLFGMAVGGMVMSSTRAVVVLVDRDVVYGVQFAVDQWLLLDRGVPADPGRAVRPGDDAGEPVPDVGPRGVPHDPAPHRARVLRVRPQLPGRAARAARRAGDGHHPARRRASTRCASSPSSARLPDRHAAARGRGADPRGDDGRLPRSPRAGCSAASSGWPAREGRLSVRWQ